MPAGVPCSVALVGPATAYEPTKPATNNTQLQSNHPKTRNSADQLWGISLIGVNTIWTG